MSVKVGVRVRPFNQREKDLSCRLCVDMMGPTTRLFDADDPEKHRDFTFDYSFWSHDQFHPDERGYFIGDTQKYADQQHVFQQVGLQILSNAWQGYHCCLFAYGQTGAGKSYSMVGYGANKGIVPISCEEIFRRIQGNTDKNKEYEVNVSMLEIYNQKVQDLLVPINKRLKEGYKIREHKTLGIYVEGLSKHYVDTYESIEAKMEEGSKNRSIAATEMNASSSRAHTIISIEFRQIDMVQGKKRQKLSVIYLVDLAGSQKVGKTGATGDRLKEAAGINKSLSVLGLVISTLADKAMGKAKNVIVPYRDSCLTRILQNALGGNSKTLMICAISPATDNYQETLSTLRYADQAKKIQNKAVVNESQTDKIIRNLTQQKDELREKVQKFQEMFKKLSQGLGIDPQKLQQFNDAKQQLRFNTQMMKDYAMSKSQKLQKDEEHTQQKKINKNEPHISNLNEDPQLSKRINYPLDKQIQKIGKRNSTPPNDIEIGGMGIRSQHAHIIKKQDKFFIVPIMHEGQDSGCYLNGDPIISQQQLHHLDRLTFGTNNMFIVFLPNSATDSTLSEQQIDWDFAQNQLYLKKDLIEKKALEEKEKKLKEESQRVLKDKERELQELQRKVREHEEMRRNMEEKNQMERVQMERRFREEEAQRLKRELEAEKLKKEIQKDRKKIKDRENQNSQRIKEKYYFEKKLLKTLPQCIEINLIAKQFKRNITMSVKMLMNCQPEESQDFLDVKKRSIKIKVVNKETGYVYWWDSQKLANRYYMIKDMSQQYFETGIIPKLEQNEDPFWDPPEPFMIGYTFLTTKGLTYLFDNPMELSIIGEDDICGELTVNMIPTDQKGEKNLCEEIDDEQEFEPEYLLGKPFYFNMVIEKAIIPLNYVDVFVEYSIKTSEDNLETFQTPVITQKTKNPVFNYKALHSFPVMTQQLLDYLSNAKITLKVYGTETAPIEPLNVGKNTQNKSLEVPDAEAQVPQTQKVNTTQTTQGSQNSGTKSNIFQSSLKAPINNKSSEKKQEKSRNLPDSLRAKKEAEIKKKNKQDCQIF